MLSEELLMINVKLNFVKNTLKFLNNEQELLNLIFHVQEQL